MAKTNPEGPIARIEDLAKDRLSESLRQELDSTTSHLDRVITGLSYYDRDTQIAGMQYVLSKFVEATKLLLGEDGMALLEIPTEEPRD